MRPELGCSAARSCSMTVARPSSWPGFSCMVMSCAHMVLPCRRVTDAEANHAGAGGAIGVGLAAAGLLPSTFLRGCSSAR